MRRTLWITLLSLALALSAYSSGARAAAMPLHRDCCDTLCHDMPGCAAVVVCQACTASAASLTQHRVVSPPQDLAFSRAASDHPPTGPVPPIWSPPD